MTTALPVTDLAANRRVLGRYRIIREIGRGGYSVVYAADDLTLGTEVALKLLVAPPAMAAEAKERLRREVQVVRGLRHPSIVGVHDFVEADGFAFVVMDLIDGEDLAGRLNGGGPLALEAAVTVGRDVATALAAAHRTGLLHRDVKPANILLDREGRAHLADFGSARLDSQTTITRTGGLVGTVAYLAPEVWLGARPDARAEVYALGVTLFEAITGSLPARPSAHLPPTPEVAGFHPAAVKPGTPPWLDQIVAMATIADPRLRFPTAEAMAEWLDRRAFPPNPIVAATLAALDAPPPPPEAIPLALKLMLAGVAVAGIVAGVEASPAFFVATPAVALLVWRQRTRRGHTALPGETPKWELIGSALEAYRLLPQGAARALVDDVLVLARARVERAATESLASRWRTELDPLVATAVQAGADLEHIDQTIRQLGQAVTHARRVPAGYWETQTGLEQTRDGLSTLLLETIATLGRAERIAVDEFDSARFQLEEMVAGLKGDLDRTVLAARNLETALGNSQRPISAR